MRGEGRVREGWKECVRGGGECVRSGGRVCEGCVCVFACMFCTI